jgi:hypothetical protein
MKFPELPDYFKNNADKNGQATGPTFGSRADRMRLAGHNDPSAMWHQS